MFGNTTMVTVAERTLESRSFLKFRCRLDSEAGPDAHREFSGVFYPRWRSIYLDEIRTVRGTLKLFPVFELTVMFKPDGEYFYPSDFTPGASLSLGASPYSRDVAPKTFIVTSVDDSQLLSCAKGQGGTVKHSQGVVSDRLLDRIRDCLVQRSGSLPQGIKDCGRRFRQPNDSGKRVMDPEQFSDLCEELQVGASSREVEGLFARFDKNADGQVSYEEFVNALQGTMNETRKRCVADLFKVLDHDRDGFISPKEMQARYRAEAHPDVVAGAVTRGQVLNGFLSAWDTREPNGRIPYAEFCDYYRGVSAVVEDDREFQDIVTGAWKL